MSFQLIPDDSSDPRIPVSGRQLAAVGASERAIMNQTGHRSVQMVRRYIREGTVFDKENAAGKAGL